MTTVFVSKVNETSLKVESDNFNVLFELREHFSFFAPNYRHSPKFKDHIWDGKIYLLNMKSKTIPYGLIHHVQKFCSDHNYLFVDQTKKSKMVVADSLDDFDEFVESLKLPFKPYDYQIDAVKTAIRDMRRLLISPTGSGKSLIIYMLLRWMHKNNRRTCIIVPSTSLVEQMVSDFKKYAENDDSFDVASLVDRLYSKVNTDPFQSNILVSTWQSLITYDESLGKEWDCVICDEVHLGKSTSIQKILNSATNAPYRIGLTGSLTGEDVHEFILIGSFGLVHRVATTKELQESGQLSDMRIYMLMLRYPKEESVNLYRNIGKDYNTEYKYITTHAKRALFVRNLACSSKGTVMVLFDSREHGELLYKLISEKLGDGNRKVFHIDGRVKVSTREEIRNAVNSENGAIIVASVGTSATGLNIPSIENVILCPSKSRVRNLQSIGRGLRLNKGKNRCNVFDLCDNLSYGNHKNYFLNHGMQRYALYQQEGFDVVFEEVAF